MGKYCILLAVADFGEEVYIYYLGLYLLYLRKHTRSINIKKPANHLDSQAFVT